MTAPPTVESVFQPHLTKRAGNSYKLCSPAALELSGAQAELIVFRTDTVALLNQRTWGADQLELRQQELYQL